MAVAITARPQAAQWVTRMTTLLEHYHEEVRTGLVIEDPQQLEVLQHLQKIQQHLLKASRKTKFFKPFHRSQFIKGLYLWGGVGVGKTFLMDSFFHSLPFPNKLRMHFYQFMQMVHEDLKKYQGKKDPLKIIAHGLAQKTLVLCFDEFFVTDIADAMILGRLLEALFAAGICVVLTSNFEPDELYKNGLQRQHFLPTIAFLKKHTDVVHLESQTDYRLLHLKRAGVFYIPNDSAAQDNMEKSFLLLAQGEPISTQAIELFGRKIPIVKATQKIIWFDFNVLCQAPRSQQDYLALAKQYHTILISDVPVIPSGARDKVSLFIKLVDVLYDAHIRLVLSVAVPLEKIYIQGPLLFEFNRTLSRLIEMQSETYFLK